MWSFTALVSSLYSGWEDKYVSTQGTGLTPKQLSPIPYGDLFSTKGREKKYKCGVPLF